MIVAFDPLFTNTYPDLINVKVNLLWGQTIFVIFFRRICLIKTLMELNTGRYHVLSKSICKFRQKTSRGIVRFINAIRHILHIQMVKHILKATSINLKTIGGGVVVFSIMTILFQNVFNGKRSWSFRC